MASITSNNLCRELVVHYSNSLTPARNVERDGKIRPLIKELEDAHILTYLDGIHAAKGDLSKSAALETRFSEINSRNKVAYDKLANQQLAGSSTKDNAVETKTETDASCTERSLSNKSKLHITATNASAAMSEFHFPDKESEEITVTNLMHPEERLNESSLHVHFEASAESPSLQVETNGLLHQETVGRCSQKERISKHVTKGVGKASRVANGNTHSLLPSPRVLRSPYSRRCSPASLDWFPRCRTESYLERKIRMLQEKEGIKASLDETLGASNLHLSRIEREKRAAQAAAKEAMEARRAALVEASWCRILKLAGIPSTLAVSALQQAAQRASEALTAAAALGVILRNSPESPKLVEVRPTAGAAEPKHNVTASLDTAFDIDREVAAAVKIALRQVSHVPCGLEENLDYDYQEMGSCGCEEAEAPELTSDNKANKKDDLCCEERVNGNAQETNLEVEDLTGLKLRKGTNNVIDEGYLFSALLPPKNPTNTLIDTARGDYHNSEVLINQVVERVKALSHQDCSSLAKIVATRGLSDLLKQENLEQELGCKNDKTKGLSEMLIKHVSRLEAEKAGAKLTCNTEEGSSQMSKTIPDALPDLGSILVKHIPKFQKEMQRAKESTRIMETAQNKTLHESHSNHTTESLDKILVKRLSRLEKEKLAASTKAVDPSTEYVLEQSRGWHHYTTNPDEHRLSLVEILKKPVNRFRNECGLMPPNVDLNSREGAAQNGTEPVDSIPSTDSEASNLAAETFTKEPQKVQCKSMISTESQAIDSLDKILVKRLSRLEKEKLAASRKAADASTEDVLEQSRGYQHCNRNPDEHKLSLAEILKKPMNHLRNPTRSMPTVIDVNFGEGAEQNVDKANPVAITDTETSTLAANNFTKEPQKSQCESKRPPGHTIDSLDQILVKRLSKLEKEKLAASRNAAGPSPEDALEQSTGSQHFKNISDEHKQSLAEILKKPANCLRNPCSSVPPIKEGNLGEGAAHNLHGAISDNSVAITDAEVSTLGSANSTEEPENVQNESSDGLFSNGIKKSMESTRMVEMRASNFRVESQFQQTTDSLGKISIKHLSRLEKEKLTTTTASSIAAIEQAKDTLHSTSVTYKHKLGPGDVLEKLSQPSNNSSSSIPESTVKVFLEETEKRNTVENDHGIRLQDAKATTIAETSATTLRVVKEGEIIHGRPNCNQIAESGAKVSDGKLVVQLPQDKPQPIIFGPSEKGEDTALNGESNFSLEVSCSRVIDLQNENQKASEKVQRKLSKTRKSMDAWHGMSLETALKRHVSKLEREQAAWKKAEEEARQRSFQATA